MHNVFILLDTLQSVDELTAEASLSSHVLRPIVNSETEIPKVNRFIANSILAFNVYFALKLEFLKILFVAFFLTILLLMFIQ